MASPRENSSGRLKSVQANLAFLWEEFGGYFVLRLLVLRLLRLLMNDCNSIGILGAFISLRLRRA
jgi:hypothetical protein